MPDLLQVQQALPPQVRRLEELHCNRARPAARVSPCPPPHTSCCPPASAPPVPSQALLSSPCQPVPGPLPPQDAPEHPCPGMLHPRHPLLQASSHDQGTCGTSVPKRDGSRAGSLPLLLRRVCRAEPGTALAFSPCPPPRHSPAPREPVPRAGSNGAIVGPLCPPHCGHSLGRERHGAGGGTPHIPLPLMGLFTWDQDSWMSPFRVTVSCPTPVLLPCAGTLE